MRIHSYIYVYVYIIYIVIYLYKKCNTKHTYAKKSHIHTEEGNRNPSQKPHPSKQRPQSSCVNTASRWDQPAGQWTECTHHQLQPQNAGWNMLPGSTIPP